MRYAIAIIIVVLAVLSIGSTNIDSGPARIQVTGSIALARTVDHHSVRIYNLYNRPAYPDKLGTAVVKCLTINKRWTECTLVVRLGRGEIMGRTLSPSVAQFRNYAITGGTGYYSNVGGEMFVQPIGSGLIFVINLIGFSSF